VRRSWCKRSQATHALELAAAKNQLEATEADNERLKTENAQLRRRVSELEAQLNESIRKEDVPQCWLTVLNLYQEDKIEDKDTILLKHLASRMKHASCAKTRGHTSPRLWCHSGWP
jgi:predicted RNase H-like nuclease (RuvC/YqgF family)